MGEFNMSIESGDAVYALKTGKIDALGHQANMRGVMGAGIAKTIKNVYPMSFIEYRDACLSKKFNLGDILVSDVGNGRYIVHLAGQDGYSTLKRQTNYEALEQALQKFADFCLASNLRPGLPYGIGCGLGGGDWAIVSSIIDKVFGDKITLYKYDKHARPEIGIFY